MLAPAYGLLDISSYVTANPNSSPAWATATESQGFKKLNHSQSLIFT